MHIAIDARFLNESHSGIAEYSKNLLVNLSQIDSVNRYTVFIHPGFSRRLRLGKNFEVSTYGARPVSLRTLTAFSRKVALTGCDFLHSLYPIAPIFGVRKQILTIHDLQPFAIQETFSRGNMRSSLGSLFYRLTFPHFIRSAKWLISVSHSTKNKLVDLFPDSEHKTIVIHSGVEEQYHQVPEPAIIQMVIKKLQIPPLFVLYIGSAQPNKNLPMMIRAFGACKNNHPVELEGLQFIMVVGRDHYSSECRRLIRSMGLQDCIRTIGPITEEEKRVLYHRARVLFCVTRGEGFGFPLVEAQASGLPVLAGNDAATPEVLGSSGLLVDPDDSKAIERNLTEVLLSDSLHSELRELGLRNVARFSWNTTARRVLEVYSLLMW